MKDWIRGTLAVETGCENLVQPRGENNNSYIILRTDLFEYLRVLTPDAEGVRSNWLGKSEACSPLTSRRMRSKALCSLE